MILLVDKIEKSFGARTLFSGASFQINAGERYALVGPNGAGKTTMLKIIMGIDTADAGTVTYAKDVNVGYLEQETKLASDKPIIAEVMDAAIEIQNLGHRAEELQLKIAEADGTDPTSKPCSPNTARFRTASSIWAATSWRATHARSSPAWAFTQRISSALL